MFVNKYLQMGLICCSWSLIYKILFSYLVLITEIRVHDAYGLNTCVINLGKLLSDVKQMFNINFAIINCNTLFLKKGKY